MKAPRVSVKSGEPQARTRGVDVNLRSGPQMREYEEIADRIARDRPARVLDWGCGFGQLSELMRLRGIQGEAFDFDPDLESDTVEPLERYPHLSVHLSPHPFRLPYADDEFDGVVSCGVLEHVQDPDASLEELRRVLRPGGTLYVYKLPNRWSYLELVARLAGIYYHGKLEHDRVYTRSSARRLLQAHGFELLELRRANMLPLTLPGRVAERATGAIWGLNRALASVPVLNLLATNVELVARSPANAT